MPEIDCLTQSRLLIAVSGGSCSGKTTLARALLNTLTEERASLIYQDSYYIDQSARFKEDGGDVNFDHPDAIDFSLIRRHLQSLLDGQKVDVPIYDFKTHQRLPKTEACEPRPVVIVDGTLLLSQAIVRDLFQVRIFIDCPESARFERRQRRDTTERGRTAEGVRRQFLNHVKPMHDQFVQPSKDYASICFNDDFDLNSALDQVAHIIDAWQYKGSGSLNQ
jgi:uridine kinase